MLSVSKYILPFITHITWVIVSFSVSFLVPLSLYGGCASHFTVKT